MARKRIPDELLERAVPVGHGVPGSHEIGALWAPTDDPRILNERLRRREAQVTKLKKDRQELKDAMKLKTEEAYNDGLLAVAPALLEIDKKITAVVDKMLTAGIDEDNLKVLKALLPELSKQRDRLYGKTRQRVQSTSLSASVDINELQRQAQAMLPKGGAGDPEAAIDVDVIDEEMRDE